MSYNQAMKHWSNHRKDRFFQQCSWPISTQIIKYSEITEEAKIKASNETLSEIIKNADDYTFPIFIYVDCRMGIWEIVQHNHIAGIEIKTKEDLLEFSKEANEYI